MKDRARLKRVAMILRANRAKLHRLIIPMAILRHACRENQKWETFRKITTVAS